MFSILKKPAANVSDLARAVGQLIDRVQAQQILQTPQFAIQQTSNGVLPQIRTPKQQVTSYPFDIYPVFPAVTDGSGWRKVAVRAGNVGLIVATGTDGSATTNPVTNPDSDVWPTATQLAGQIITCDEETDDFKIWLELTFDADGAITAAAVKSGETEWTDYPNAIAADGATGRILLGTVDTLTKKDNHLIDIRQLVRADLPEMRKIMLCAGSYALIAMSKPCAVT